MEKYAWDQPTKLQKAMIFALAVHEPTHVWGQSSYIHAVLHSS